MIIDDLRSADVITDDVAVQLQRELNAGVGHA